MASKSKSSKAKRKGKSKRGAGSKKPAPLFAPVKPYPKDKRGAKRRQKQLISAGAGRPPIKTKTGQSIAQKRGAVYRILLSRGVASEVAQTIVDMEPGEHYLLEIYGYVGSRDDVLDYDGDFVPVLQAMFVGEAEKLWGDCIGYASKAPIQDVRIDELDDWAEHRPLWDTDSIHTTDGVLVDGHGSRVDWQKDRDERKRGPRKKSGGGMTAEERRAQAKQRQAARSRRNETRERVDALYAKARAADKAGKSGEAQKIKAKARQLLKRSKRARKVEL